MGKRRSWGIDLTDLIERERISTVERLRARIESIQDEIVSRLARLGWSRAATYTRSMVTSLGEFVLRIVKVRRGDHVISPILDALGIRRRRYSPELRMILADMAARLSYSDTRVQFMELSGIDIPKRTIHSFVQEVGRKLNDALANRQQRESMMNPRKELLVVMADGTKTHRIYPTQNNVKVSMAYDERTREKRVVSIGVNNGWDDAEGKTPNDTIIVSDAEKGIPEKINHSAFQLDLVHAVRDSLYRMWMDGASREERRTLSSDMKRVLYTLFYSVKRHLKDGDRKTLSQRIESTIKELNQLADEMEEKGYLKTSTFIRSHARFMVTFARVALDKHIRIPHTSNAIERMMGDISKRCKQEVQAQVDEVVNRRPREHAPHTPSQIRRTKILQSILVQLYPSPTIPMMPTAPVYQPTNEQHQDI